KKDAERVSAAVLPLIDGVITAKDKEKEEYRKKWYKIIEAVCEPHKHQICRECADSNGTCPHDNLSCDPTDRVIERFKMKDKEIEQLRDRIQKHMSTLLSPERYQGMQIALDMINELVSRKNRQPTEHFTGPVVGIEDGTEFNNGR